MAGPCRLLSLIALELYLVSQTYQLTIVPMPFISASRHKLAQVVRWRYRRLLDLSRALLGVRRRSTLEVQIPISPTPSFFTMIYISGVTSRKRWSVWQREASSKRWRGLRAIRHRRPVSRTSADRSIGGGSIGGSFERKVILLPFSSDLKCLSRQTLC